MASKPPQPSAPPGHIRAAAQAVAQALNDKQCYAVVGGAACSLLGSTRYTVDIDIVVPKGSTKAARSLLKSRLDDFEIDPRTQHTAYRSVPPVQIEILTPPLLFRGEFTSSTPVISVQGVQVLKPALILNAKCKSIIDRPSEQKRDSDAGDIKFLLTWCAENNINPQWGDEVPNATLRFVQYFISVYSEPLLWTNVGFDLKGTMSLWPLSRE